MRNEIILYINGERHALHGEQAFMPVGDYLRYIKGLTGTKIVCAEGDCGACTVLQARVIGDSFSPYISVNSCISRMYLLDKCHLITVEGLGKSIDMHPVQEVFVDQHGAQCGYCTPGFICAMAGMANDLKANGKEKTPQKIKNYLTGNLCRCTGYEPIIKAGMELNLNKVEKLSLLYNDEKILSELIELKGDVEVKFLDQHVYLPDDLQKAVAFRKENENAKLVSGATDLGVVANKGKLILNEVLSLNNIDSAYEIKETEGGFEIGAKASLDLCEKKLEKDFPEFSSMLHIFASPQIKNIGTLIGNLVNASPIADTVPFLMVANVDINLIGPSAERTISINKFFKGNYKELDIAKDEIVKSVFISKTDHAYKLYKVSIRRDLDISSVTFAARYKMSQGKMTEINLAFGGVGPIVLRMPELEADLMSASFDSTLIKSIVKKIPSLLTPLSDHRGSKEFRTQICQNLLFRFFDEVSGSAEASV